MTDSSPPAATPSTPTPAAPTPRRKSLLPKIVFGAVLVIAAVVVGGYLFAGSALNGVVRRAVEHVGTQTTGVATTLRGASINVRGGGAMLTGLNIANPPGFKADRFMSLESTDVDLNVGTIRSDTIEVSHVKLSGIVVNLEGTPGSMNYDAILDHIKKQGREKKPSEPGTKFIVKTIELKDVKANVKVGILPETTVRFDTLVINDLGSEGLTAEELTQVVVQVVLEGIAANGGGILPADLMKDLNSSLGSLTDLGLEGLNTIGAGIGETGKKLGEEAGKVLGDLFGGEKKKDGK